MIAHQVENLKLPEEGEDASATTPAPATAPETSTESSSTGEGGEGSLTASDISMMRKAMRKGIIESKNKLEILRQDPNNPLYSVKDFESLNLRPELLQSIYNMGFKLPSKIQETALPTLLANP